MSRDMGMYPGPSGTPLFVWGFGTLERRIWPGALLRQMYFLSASWLPDKMPKETFGECDYHAGTLSGEPLYPFSWHRHEVGEKMRVRMQVIAVACDNA